MRHKFPQGIVTSGPILTSTAATLTACWASNSYSTTAFFLVLSSKNNFERNGKYFRKIFFSLGGGHTRKFTGALHVEKNLNQVVPQTENSEFREYRSAGLGLSESSNTFAWPTSTTKISQDFLLPHLAIKTNINYLDQVGSLQFCVD